MLHVPYGCSVWGAAWSQAANWPSGGEIDTFEGGSQGLLFCSCRTLLTARSISQSTSSKRTRWLFTPQQDAPPSTPLPQSLSTELSNILIATRTPTSTLDVPLPTPTLPRTVKHSLLLKAECGRLNWPAQESKSGSLL